jgi:hypothetical protein
MIYKFLFLSTIVREDSNMKRRASLFLAISLAALAYAAVANAQTSAGNCTRGDLNKATDNFFTSIQEHKTSSLQLASDIKYTENGVKKEVGKGFWETAGKPLLKRTVIDTKKCVAATIAVVEEKYTAQAAAKPATGAPGGGMGGFGGGMGGPGGGMGAPGGGMGGFGGGMGGPGGGMGGPGGGMGGRGGGMGAPGGGMGGMFGGSKPPAEGTVRPILFAARLKTEKGKITEIETIVARESDFAFNADGVLKTKDQDWETILKPEQRATRKELADAANNYFALFSEDSTVSVPFAKVCDRWENGMQTTEKDHDCSPVTFRKQIGMSINHGPRRVWVDTEKGISIGFMVFGGGATVSKDNPTGSGLVDCHMFRMRDGKVDLILSIVGPRAETMGWPLEPIE